VDADPAILSGGLPEGVTLRPAGPSDHDFQRVLYASTRFLELEPVPWDEATKVAFLAAQFEAQTLHYDRYYSRALRLIVEDHGASAGRLFLEEIGDELRIVDIALLPEHRGRGIGTALLAAVLALAASRGRSATIHVEKANPARELYLRLGFLPESEYGVYDFLRWRPPSGAAAVST
jgi:ribosomal protein S18 acetylase RimI-like enzyme